MSKINKALVNKLYGNLHSFLDILSDEAILSRLPKTPSKLYDPDGYKDDDGTSIRKRKSRGGKRRGSSTDVYPRLYNSRVNDTKLAAKWARDNISGTGKFSEATYGVPWSGTHQRGGGGGGSVNNKKFTLLRTGSDRKRYTETEAISQSRVQSIENFLIDEGLRQEMTTCVEELMSSQDVHFLTTFDKDEEEDEGEDEGDDGSDEDDEKVGGEEEEEQPSNDDDSMEVDGNDKNRNNSNVSNKTNKPFAPSPQQKQKKDITKASKKEKKDRKSSTTKNKTKSKNNKKGDSSSSASIYDTLLKGIDVDSIDENLRFMLNSILSARVGNKGSTPSSPSSSSTSPQSIHEAEEEKRKEMEDIENKNNKNILSLINVVVSSLFNNPVYKEAVLKFLTRAIVDLIFYGYTVCLVPIDMIGFCTNLMSPGSDSNGKYKKSVANMVSMTNAQNIGTVIPISNQDIHSGDLLCFRDSSLYGNSVYMFRPVSEHAIKTSKYCRSFVIINPGHEPLDGVFRTGVNVIYDAWVMTKLAENNYNRATTHLSRPVIIADVELPKVDPKLLDSDSLATIELKVQDSINEQSKELMYFGMASRGVPPSVIAQFDMFVRGSSLTTPEQKFYNGMVTGSRVGTSNQLMHYSGSRRGGGGGGGISGLTGTGYRTGMGSSVPFNSRTGNIGTSVNPFTGEESHMRSNISDISPNEVKFMSYESFDLPKEASVMRNDSLITLTPGFQLKHYQEPKADMESIVFHTEKYNDLKEKFFPLLSNKKKQSSSVSSANTSAQIEATQAVVTETKRSIQRLAINIFDIAYNESGGSLDEMKITDFIQEVTEYLAYTSVVDAMREYFNESINVLMPQKIHPSDIIGFIIGNDIFPKISSSSNNKRKRRADKLIISMVETFHTWPEIKKSISILERVAVLTTRLLQRGTVNNVKMSFKKAVKDPDSKLNAEKITPFIEFNAKLELEKEEMAFKNSLLMRQHEMEMKKLEFEHRMRVEEFEFSKVAQKMQHEQAIAATAAKENKAASAAAASSSASPKKAKDKKK